MKNITQVLIWLFLLVFIYWIYSNWMKYKVDVWNYILNKAWLADEVTTNYKDKVFEDFSNDIVYEKSKDSNPLGAFKQIDKIERLITFLKYNYKDPTDWLPYIIEDDNPRPVINLWETGFENSQTWTINEDNSWAITNVGSKANTLDKIKELKDRIEARKKEEEQNKQKELENTLSNPLQ